MLARIANLLTRKRYLLTAFFVVLGSYFVAGAMSSVLASVIRKVPELSSATKSKGRKPSRASRVDYVAMAERNLFGAMREDLSPVPLDEGANDAKSVVGPYDPVNLKDCSAAISVRGTMVAEGLPEWSMAAVYVNKLRETQIFSAVEGLNEIDEETLLVDILERSIVVLRRDEYESCDCDAEKKGKEKPKVSSKGKDTGGGGAGVEKLNEGSYRIDPEERDRVFNNLSEVATQARVVPSFKNGKPNGFKMFSIKPNSIFSKLGMKNGDIIQKVNGHDIDSPDKALELYSKLKESGDINFEFQRRGRSKSVAVEVGR